MIQTNQHPKPDHYVYIFDKQCRCENEPFGFTNCISSIQAYQPKKKMLKGKHIKICLYSIRHEDLFK